MANTPLHIPELIKMGKWVDYRDPIWGDSYNWSWNRRPDEVKYLVIHHTVTKHEATPDDIALLHKARGWGGIGYHFVITKDGTVYYVGDVGTARANVLNMNEQVIGISLIGDFTKHNPSDEQIISAHELCRFFLFEAPSFPNIKSWDDVVGHKELQATACPGTYWKGVSDSIYERIKNRIPYTPLPDPEPEPPATDEKYRVTHKGTQIAELEYNPIEKIKQLEQELKDRPVVEKEKIVEVIKEVPKEVIVEKVVEKEVIKEVVKEVTVTVPAETLGAKQLITLAFRAISEGRW